MELLSLKKMLYHDLGLPDPKTRRKMLCDEMDALSDKQIHCLNCTGTCCTMSANSMQITPLEAFEIIQSLALTAETVNAIKDELRTNIRNYRLDHEIFLGKKSHHFLRKTYTCPFFSPGPKGCTIKKELKPYGCLGFNPRIEGDNGSQCHSDFDLLQKREDPMLILEAEANDYLKNKFELTWNKCEIPKAVLALLDNLFK
ncbi:MAG: hypothetical protein KBD76_01640 [Bacteriovorax sp.]|jgi:Fe-S-cluster containining protein|nr:hypothetical protein [Bacteriovorax sp.]